MTKFKLYIIKNPNKTIIYTYHKPLIGLFKNKDPNDAQQTHWYFISSMFGVNIKYESSKKNVITDALSIMKNTKKRKNTSIYTFFEI